MRTADLISACAYILAGVINLIPEVRSFVSGLDLAFRIPIILAYFLLPITPSIYSRYLKPKKVADNYAFDPFLFYPNETNKCIAGDIPCIELFFSSEGLTEDRVDIRIADPEEFKLPSGFSDIARTMWEEQIQKRFQKEEKEEGSHATARLFDLREDRKKERVILYFQKAEYWQAHITNFNLDWLGWGKHLREKITGHQIKTLNQSEYSANHLGMNCVLLTEDGKIVLQKRSRRVAVNTGLIGLSAEGAMAWEDRTSRYEAPSPFIGMFRELHEELGVVREQLVDMRLVSVYRNLYWGGKPAAFFVAKTNKTWEEVHQMFKTKPRQAWETDYLIPLNNEPGEIKERMEEKETSFPAKVGLYYYLKVIKHWK